MIFESALDVFGSRCRRFWRFLEEGGAAFTAFKPASRRVRKEIVICMYPIKPPTQTQTQHSTPIPNVPNCIHTRHHSKHTTARHCCPVGKSNPAPHATPRSPTLTLKPPTLTFITVFVFSRAGPPRRLLESLVSICLKFFLSGELSV